MSDNYFDLFGLKLGYDINIEELNSKYFDLLKIHHPDNLNDEKTELESKSILINQAYKTLKSNEDRIDYLLKLKNIDIGDDSEIKPSHKLLSMILEYREKLFEIIDIEELSNMELEIKDNLDSLINQFKSSYEKDLDVAVEYATGIKYYFKILEEIKTKKNEFNNGEK